MFGGCFVLSDYVPRRGLWAPGSLGGGRCPLPSCPWVSVCRGRAGGEGSGGAQTLRAFGFPDTPGPGGGCGRTRPRGRRGSGRASPLRSSLRESEDRLGSDLLWGLPPAQPPSPAAPMGTEADGTARRPFSEQLPPPSGRRASAPRRKRPAVQAAWPLRCEQRLPESPP